MTSEQLKEILAMPPEDVIKALSKSSYVIPKWEDLNKQYDANEHRILKDLVTYPPIIGENGQDEMKRITFDLQKLLVDRSAQLMFGSSVYRSYNYDTENEQQQQAVDLIEEIYAGQNNIDAANIERAKKNNASCQVATVWRAKPKTNTVEGIQSEMQLTHSIYSEMDGYKLWPITDEYGDLLVLSIEYKDMDEVERFDIYAGGDVLTLTQYSKVDDWKLTEVENNPQQLTLFPVSYTHMSEPVWGGDSGTTKVENLEELVSYRALYIKKNSVPMAMIDYGDKSGMSDTDNKETNEDRRRLVTVGVGGNIKYITWDLDAATFDGQVKLLKDEYFSENQIPDISFANLVSSNASADNKELMLTDSKAKAVDLGGEWVKMFNAELNDIVFGFAKVLYPSLASALDLISVRSVIIPYNVKTDKDRADFVALAGSSMSLETKVRYLDKVANISAEVEAIENEQQQQANNLL